MKNDKAQNLLRELGLNQLEAEIYMFMLPQQPMTAYKIAKHVGKPTANVYKAVETLSRKGALIIEDGSSRICHAVSPRDFLKRAEKDFHEVSAKTRNALKNIEVSPLDEFVYRVVSIEQVYSYCRDMLEKAKVIAVIDAFPIPLQKITPLIEKAIKRGVEVFIEAYEDISIKGAKVTFIPLADRLVNQWNAQQMNIVIDGKENLMALLTHDGTDILQAFWSNSLYLSCLHHGGRLCEQTLVRAIQARKNGASAKEIVSIIESHPFFISKPVPGQVELNIRYSIKEDDS